MEDITDADYLHAKKICKDFNIKKLGKYHDLYVQSHTFLLVDVFSYLIWFLEHWEFSKYVPRNIQT